MPFLIEIVREINNAQTGVVPVVAQAGTALFPLIVLGISSVIGLLLKPKELLRVFREKPWIPLVLVLLGVGSWLVINWLFFTEAAPVTRSGTAAGASAARSGTAAGASAALPAGRSTTDWTKVALAIIEQDAEAASHPEVPAAAAAPMAAVTAKPAGAATPAASKPAPGGARFFRGGLDRSGHLDGPAPVALTPAWSYFAQDELNSMCLSSPIVMGDAVFGASCYLDPPNSYGSIFRLDAKTGKQQWICEFKNGKSGDFKGFFSSPAVTADGRFLVIGQGLHMDYDSELVCLDAVTGAVRWLLPTFLHIESSPCIEGDLVVAGAGAVEQGEDHKPVGDPKGRGNPGFIVGVRISDGVEVFRAAVNDPEGSPLLSDGICYAGSGINGSAVVALRTQSDADLKAKGQNRELWRTTTPYPATGAVTMAGDLLLVGCGNGDFVFAAKNPEGLVIALDKTTGSERWRATVPDAVLGPIAVSGDLAVVPIRNGEIAAISLKEHGKMLWRVRVNKTAPVLAGPTIADGRIYAISNDGYLVVVAADSGAELERIYINAKGKPGEMGLCTSSPIISGGRLFVGSETGGLRCFTGSAK